MGSGLLAPCRFQFIDQRNHFLAGQAQPRPRAAKTLVAFGQDL